MKTNRFAAVALTLSIAIGAGAAIAQAAMVNGEAKKSMSRPERSP
jgi:hypothetical protein